jgi:hypothetical protein
MRVRPTRIQSLFLLPLLALAAAMTGLAVASPGEEDKVSNHAKTGDRTGPLGYAHDVGESRNLDLRRIAATRRGPGERADVNGARARRGGAVHPGVPSPTGTVTVPPLGEVQPPTAPQEPSRPAAEIDPAVQAPAGPAAPRASAAVEPGVPVTLAPAPAPGLGSLAIGVDGGYAGWSPTEIQERTELGAAVTRHEWDPSEPVDAQDEVVEVAAGTIHTRIHALLGGNQLGDPTHYREWVLSFIRRYGPGGSFWAAHPELDASRYAITSVELGNEPYFGEMSAELYADTVRPTLESIRDLGLPVTVMLPAYVYGDDTSWIDTLYERIPDLNTLFDGFAFHPYWYGHDPATPGDGGPFERIDTVRAAMDGLGAAAKPIYLTEYGESTAGCGGECVSEATQAEHLREMIETVVANTDWNVDMLSIFQLRDRGTNSGDRELQFGLLREDGLPKPSYGIVRAAMQVHR